MREAKIELELKEKTEQLGGICLKCSSPGMNGIPDRIVLYRGRIWFVEVKAPGKRPRKLQEYIHKQIKAQGFDVRTLDSLKGVADFIYEIQTARLPRDST